MKPTWAKCLKMMTLLVLMLVSPGWAAAQMTFSHIVVFGDSLSDTGNAFALIKTQSTPPYSTLDPLLVPSAPYAKGGHHFSNGATWVEQFARPLGLAADARPALLGSGAKAANYAVGGARAHNDGMNFDLSLQVAAFLQDSGGIAPSDTLYTLEFGGNDVRDALAAANPGILNDALTQIGNNISLLYQRGARKFFVWNAPDLSLTPSVRLLNNPLVSSAARSLSQAYNAGLTSVLAGLSQLPGIKIVTLDLFQIITNLVADPQAFGLTVADLACIEPNQPPFECTAPDDFLFWDGIHPTKAGHAILAQDAALALAQP